MTGRGRTCDAPRFKRALYRLSYGHVNGRSRARTGGLLLIREALCQLSYPPSTFACLSSPRLGARRTCGRSDTLRSSRFGTLAVSPTKLSMPLAYPSTLDRRPGAQRPTWRGVGARFPQSVPISWHAKVTRTFTREIQRKSSRTFLSQAGPQVRIELFKLSITFWLVVVDLPSETKKATHWVALTCGGVSLDLARTPRGKDETVAVLALQIGAMPARLDRRHRRRFGEKAGGCVAEV